MSKIIVLSFSKNIEFFCGYKVSMDYYTNLTPYREVGCYNHVVMCICLCVLLKNYAFSHKLGSSHNLPSSKIVQV